MVELHVDVVSCEKMRKGCWRLRLELRWRAGEDQEQELRVCEGVEVNRPWPVGETMRFMLGGQQSFVQLTHAPEEL